MNIGILGAGAMGMLFGAYLSRENDVWLIDINVQRVQNISREGVLVDEPNGARERFRPKAVADSRGLPKMDTVIVFVKSMFTRTALETNRELIGPDTYILTLQNGSGNEIPLREFARDNRIIVGSTQHNSCVTGDNAVRHGGSGLTSIGLLDGDPAEIQFLADSFTACGLECVTSGEVKRQVWRKLFTNTAASSLTAVLQVPLGFLSTDPNARKVMLRLCDEAVAVANAECGDCFSVEDVAAEVERVCMNSPQGYTSIYADIKNGVPTEVDAISGAVVEAAKRRGIEVPCHEVIVALIHSLEDKAKMT